MIKAVIFDMDGLLIDSEMISYQCYKKLIESYGYTFTMDDYVKDYPGRQLKVSLQFIKEHYHLDYDVEEKFQYFHQLELQLLQKEGVQLKKELESYWIIYINIIIKSLLLHLVWLQEQIKCLKYIILLMILISWFMVRMSKEGNHFRIFS